MIISPKQSSSSASKGTMPVIQALTKTVADLKKKSTAKDPLTSILKDAAEEEEEEAGPATRTSRSQPKVTAKETNARKRGRAAIQEEEEEEEEDIEEDEEEEEAPPKTRSPQPVTSPSRTAQPAPSSLRAIEALASHKYAPAAPKPSGSLIQAGRPGEKV